MAQIQPLSVQDTVRQTLGMIEPYNTKPQYHLLLCWEKKVISIKILVG